MLELFAAEIKALSANVKVYNLSLDKNEIFISILRLVINQAQALKIR